MATDAISTPASKKIKLWLIGKIAMMFFLGLRSLLRFKVANPEVREAVVSKHPKGSHIIAIWHENAFSTVSAHAHEGLTPMISLSKDGEMISKICVRLGYKPPVRGSSSKGGVHVKEAMVRELTTGGSGAITVDGPRGPRHQVKFGVIKIASETGVAIIPSMSKSTRFWKLRSWDRFRLPKPFSTVTTTYGEPLYVPEGLDKPEIEKYANLLEQRLNDIDPEIK